MTHTPFHMFKKTNPPQILPCSITKLTPVVWRPHWHWRILGFALALISVIILFYIICSCGNSSQCSVPLFLRKVKFLANCVYFNIHKNKSCVQALYLFWSNGKANLAINSLWCQQAPGIKKIVQIIQFPFLRLTLQYLHEAVWALRKIWVLTSAQMTMAAIFHLTTVLGHLQGALGPFGSLAWCPLFLAGSLGLAYSMHQ